MSWILNTIAALAEGGDEDDPREGEEVDEEEEGTTESLGTASSEGAADQGSLGSRVREGGVEGGPEGHAKQQNRQKQQRAVDAAFLRDDLSELQRSLRSGFKGVASFLTGEPGGRGVAQGSRATQAVSGSRESPSAQPDSLEDPPSGETQALMAAGGGEGRKQAREGEEEEEELGLSRDELRSLRWRREMERQAQKGAGEGTGVVAKGQGGAEEASVGPGQGAGEAAEGEGGGDEGEDAEDEAELARQQALAVKGIQDDLAELSKRVTSGFSRFSSVIRVVRGDDLVGPGGEPGKGGEEESLVRKGSKKERPTGEGGEAGEDGDEDGDEGDEEDDEGPAAVGKAAAEALLRAAKEDMKAISGSLASGISGISSFATRLLVAAGAEWEEDDEGGGDDAEDGTAGGGRGGWASEGEPAAVGLTDDVVAFAHNISQHPETWIDFPLPDEEDEPEDFQPTTQQEEHIEGVELRVPRLVAVRLELTPSYISEQRFWKIYFVLLHSHLPPAASAVLSTPPILAARARVVRQLQQAEQQNHQQQVSAPEAAQAQVAAVGPPSAAGQEVTDSGTSKEAEARDAGVSRGPGAAGNDETKERTQDTAAEPQTAGECAPAMATAGAAPTGSAAGAEATKEDAEDDWLDEDEDGGNTGASGGGDDEEEVSFSDLEDEEEEEEEEGRKGKGDGKGAVGGGEDVGPRKGSVGAGSKEEGGKGKGAAEKGGPGGEWVELKDGNSSGGSDNHSADWQTVDAEDLP